MKRLFGMLLVVGLTAGYASAATIGVQWNPDTIMNSDDDGGNFTPTGQEVRYGGGVIKFDMVASILTGDTLSTVSFEFEPIAGDPLSLTGGSNTMPTANDFATTSAAGPLGGAGVQVASASANPLANSLVGPINAVLGTYDLSIDTTPADTYDIFIAAPQADPMNPLVTVLNQTGGAYIYGPNLAGTTPGFFEYGIGSPEITNALGNQAANPLKLTVPEPSSLALLALGGFALLRRR